MTEPTIIRLQSESLISFLEDYDRERVLVMVDTKSPKYAQFKENLYVAMKNQRPGVEFAILDADVDEHGMVLDELDLTKDDLPALCYMSRGEDLNVCKLKESSILYLSTVLYDLLELDSSSNEEDLLSAVETATEIMDDPNLQ
ncbi:hypothetical protein RB195_015961 [Necator americanus]